MSAQAVPNFLAHYGHHFQNNVQLTLALTAAGTERNNIEGNRLLAQIGDSILDAVLSLRAFERGQSRAELSFTKQLVLSAKQRAEVATRTGITECIRYPPGCEGQPERIRAVAVSAVIGAAFLQSGRDINQAGVLIDNLGLCMTYEQSAIAQASVTRHEDIILANGMVDNDPAWDSGRTGQGLSTSVGLNEWESGEASSQMMLGLTVAPSQTQPTTYVDGHSSSIPFSYSGPDTVGVIARMEPADHYIESLETAPTDNDDLSSFPRTNMPAETECERRQSRTKDQALLQHLTEALSHSSMPHRFQELVVSYNSLEDAHRLAPQRDLNVEQRFKCIGELAGPSPVSQLLQAGHMVELWIATSEDNFVGVNDAFPAADAPSGVPGNPRSRAIGAMTDDQVRQIFPDLDPRSTEFAARRVEFLTARRQGRNLCSFVQTFGVGVLGLIAVLPVQKRSRSIIDGRLSQMSLQCIRQIVDELHKATNGTVRRNSQTVEPYVMLMLTGIHSVNYDPHGQVFV